MELQWNVYVHNFNSNQIKIFNIFNHGRFLKDVKDSLKSSKDKNEFMDKLRSSLFYYYCGKAEWEIIVTSLTSHIKTEELDRLIEKREYFREKYRRDPNTLSINLDLEKKLDVCSQVMINWDLFVEYVWSTRR